MGKEKSGRNASRGPDRKVEKRVQIGDTKPLQCSESQHCLDLHAYMCIHIHVERLRGSEREAVMENEKVQRRGGDRRINRTCPLKFSSVSAREQKKKKNKQKKKEVSPDAVH